MVGGAGEEGGEGSLWDGSSELTVELCSTHEGTTHHVHASQKVL